VIDLTNSLYVIHQNHDYKHLPDGDPHYDLAESQYNVDLGGGFNKSFDLLDVEMEFAEERIRKVQLTVPRLLRSLERFVMPEKQEGRRWWIVLKLRQLQRLFR
jgi:hypothetical protein